MFFLAPCAKGACVNPSPGTRPSQAVLHGCAALQVLDLGGMIKLTGELPPRCPPPFGQLLELSVAGTSVEGEVPECLVNSVHRLEMSNTKLGGRFPDIQSDAPLRCAPHARTALIRAQAGSGALMCTVVWAAMCTPGCASAGVQVPYLICGTCVSASKLRSNKRHSTLSPQQSAFAQVPRRRQ